MPGSPAPAAAAAASTPAFSPLYRQIKALLTRSLQGGEWQPGQAIPSEMELAARFKVSQGTVRKAVDELATENLLVRRQGKGTFVATHAEALTRYRFLRLADEDGAVPRLQRRVLECRRVKAVDDLVEVARQLGLRSGAVLVEVQRVLLAGDRPVVYEDIFLPGGPFRRLSAERLAAWTGPLYQLFEAEFGVAMVRAEEKLQAVPAEAVQAAALEVSPGVPLLKVERLAYTYGDRPVELRRGFYRTEAYHYRASLN